MIQFANRRANWLGDAAQWVRSRSLIPRPDGFRAARQWLHDGPSAHADARVDQCVQKIVEDGVDHLLSDRLFAGQAKRRRQFLGDLQPYRSWERVPRTVLLIGQRDRCLQDREIGRASW